MGQNASATMGGKRKEWGEEQDDLGTVEFFDGNNTLNSSTREKQEERGNYRPDRRAKLDGRTGCKDEYDHYGGRSRSGSPGDEVRRKHRKIKQESGRDTDHDAKSFARGSRKKKKRQPRDHNGHNILDLDAEAFQRPPRESTPPVLDDCAQLVELPSDIPVEHGYVLSVRENNDLVNWVKNGEPLQRKAKELKEYAEAHGFRNLNAEGNEAQDKLSSEVDCLINEFMLPLRAKALREKEVRKAEEMRRRAMGYEDQAFDVADADDLYRADRQREFARETEAHRQSYRLAREREDHRGETAIGATAEDIESNKTTAMAEIATSERMAEKKIEDVQADIASNIEQIGKEWEDHSVVEEMPAQNGQEKYNDMVDDIVRELEEQQAKARAEAESAEMAN